MAKIILRQDLKAALEPGDYQLAAGNYSGRVELGSNYAPGVSIDFSKFLIENGGLYATKVNPDLRVLNPQIKNATEHGILVEICDGLWIDGADIDTTKTMGIKLAGGTENEMPYRVRIKDARVVMAGAATGGSSSADAINLHTTKRGSYMRDIVIDGLWSRGTVGEGEVTGPSAENGRDLILMNIDADKTIKCGGHGWTNVHAHNINRAGRFTTKYVRGELRISGEINTMLEILAQDAIGAGGKTKILIDNALKGLSIKGQSNAESITFTDVAAPVFDHWKYVDGVWSNDIPVEQPTDNSDGYGVPIPPSIPPQTNQNMKLIHEWNCAEPYAPYGQKVKWRGLEPVEINGLPALKKIYPANAIGAQTKTSPADLTKVEFFINSLVEPGTKEFTLEFQLLVPQATIDQETNGGGHAFEVMKLASLCSYDSATFAKADDSFAAIVMMGDPEIDPQTGKLQYMPILYPYIESWEYKVGADGKAYPVKQLASKGIPGDQLVTLYQTIKLNTIITDDNGQTQGLYDGELLLWRKLEGAASPELIYERKGIKYADKEIELERYEFVTFRGGGDLRYGTPVPTEVIFLKYALYQGRPMMAVIDNPGTDPIDPIEVPETDPLQIALDAANATILSLQATMATKAVEISSLNLENKTLHEAVDRMNDLLVDNAAKFIEIKTIANTISDLCTQ